MDNYNIYPDADTNRFEIRYDDNSVCTEFGRWFRSSKSATRAIVQSMDDFDCGDYTITHYN